MSGYMAAQGLLKTLILTNANFGPSDVIEGDTRPLDSGLTNAAILWPGAVPEYDAAGLTREHFWECLLDVFTRFIDDTSHNAFGTLRDSVLATIADNPCLSETYFVISITSDEIPYEVYDNAGGGPFYVTQRLRLRIQENV